MSRDLPYVQVSGGYQWSAQQREPWMDDALCAQSDPEAFFPEKGGSTRDAKKICEECTVREQCLAYALEHHEQFGIWGGLSGKQRTQLSRRQRGAA